MDYISVVQFAEKYGISERTARNYCAEGKIEGALLTGKTWNIPSEAPLPPQSQNKAKPFALSIEKRERSKVERRHLSSHTDWFNLQFQSYLRQSSHKRTDTLHLRDQHHRHNYRKYFCRWHHRNSQSFSLYRLCHRPCNRANKRKPHKTAAFNPKSQYFRQQQVLVCRWRLQAPSQRSRRRRNHQTKRSSQPHEKPDWQIQCNKNS